MENTHKTLWLLQDRFPNIDIAQKGKAWAVKSGLLSLSFSAEGGMDSLYHAAAGQELLARPLPCGKLVINGREYTLGGRELPLCGTEIAPAGAAHPWEPSGYTCTPPGFSWPPRGKCLRFCYQGMGLQILAAYHVYADIPAFRKTFAVQNLSAGEIRLSQIRFLDMDLRGPAADAFYCETNYHGRVRNDWRRNDNDRTVHRDGGRLCVRVEEPIDYRLDEGGLFPGIETYVLLHGTGDYLNRQMEIKRMYRMLLPYVHACCFRRPNGAAQRH